MREDKVPVHETPTVGYTMVEAHLAYHIDAGHTSRKFFLDGNNLANQRARVATSFLKNRVMLPGATSRRG